MKKILTGLFLSSLCINTNAHAVEMVACPFYITVNPQSQLPFSLPYASELTYLGGVPGGPDGYTNTNSEPIQLQLIGSGCHPKDGPSCYFERPANAVYGGPNGPFYNVKNTKNCLEGLFPYIFYTK